jgi:hypothetical protein
MRCINKSVISKIRPIIEDYLDERMEKREITGWEVDFSEDVHINPANNGLYVFAKLTPRHIMRPTTMIIKVLASGKLI